MLSSIVKSLTRAPRALWVILAIGLVFRIVVILFDNAWGIFSPVAIAPDFHARATVLADAWQGGQFFTPMPDLAPEMGKHNEMRTLVAHLLAPFYILLNGSPIAGRIAIATYATGLGYVTWLFACELDLDTPLSLLAVAVATFWPSVIYRSVVLMREILVVVPVLVAIWIAVRWAQPSADTRQLVGEGVLLLIIARLLWALRPETLLILAITFVVSIGLRYHKHTRALATVAVMGIIGMIGVVMRLGAFIGPRNDNGLSPATLDAYAHVRAHGGSAYLTWLHYETWTDIVLFAPLKVLYFLAAPMPWDANSVIDLLAGMSGWLLLGVCVLAAYGAWRLFRTHPHSLSPSGSVLLTFLAAGILAYSIIEMNGGAAFRRRIQFVPIIILLAVVGLSAVRRRLKTGNAVSTVASIGRA